MCLRKTFSKQRCPDLQLNTRHLNSPAHLRYTRKLRQLNFRAALATEKRTIKERPGTIVNIGPNTLLYFASADCGAV